MTICLLCKAETCESGWQMIQTRWSLDKQCLCLYIILLLFGSVQATVPLLVKFFIQKSSFVGFISADDLLLPSSLFI